MVENVGLEASWKGLSQGDQKAGAGPRNVARKTYAV